MPKVDLYEETVFLCGLCHELVEECDLCGIELEKHIYCEFGGHTCRKHKP